MATYTRPHRTRASDLSPDWHVIDAQGKTLGRLSSEIAVLLQGKHKPTFVPYMNTGDFVVVVNAEKVRVTGNKLEQKVYYRHSGYHGGLKEQTLSELLQRTPTRVIKKAVKGMLPKNTVGRRMLSRLKLYKGDSHPHAAQVNARPKAAEAEIPPDAEPKAETAEASATTAPKVTKAKAPTGAGRATATAKARPKSAKAKSTTKVELEAEIVTAEPDADEAEAEAQPAARTGKATPAKGPRKAPAKTTKAKDTSKTGSKTGGTRGASGSRAQGKAQTQSTDQESEEA